jgi:hypothetical protein
MGGWADAGGCDTEQHLDHLATTFVEANGLGSGVCKEQRGQRSEHLDEEGKKG